MLSPETQDLLFGLLVCIAEWEERIESGRTVLVGLEDFEPYSSFTALDRFAQGYLTSADLQAFLRTKGLEITEKAAFHLGKTLDSNGDGKVTYHDFLRFILPTSKVYLSTIAVSRRPKREGLYGLVEKQLFSLFSLQLEANRAVERLRGALWSCSDFSLLDGFRCLDELEAGSISELALRRVLEKAGHATGSKAIIARFDSDNDGKIGYLDYVELVTPSQPLYREVSSSAMKQSQGLSRTPSPTRPRTLPNSTSPKKKFRPSDRSFELIAELFKLQCDLAREVEKTKEELTLKADFTLARLFRCLRKTGKWVPLDAFMTVLRTLGLEISEEDLYLLVGTVEVVLEGKLSAKDIADMMIPKQIDYARLLTTRICDQSQRFSINDFSAETKDSLYMVFFQALESRKTIETCKQRLIGYADFRPSEAFGELDSARSGKITIDQLHGALKRFGVFAASRDVMGLFWSYDANQDGSISYAEFVKAVTPRLSLPHKD
jgi:Ca2+-binding EF-hand superfamily protein